MTPEDWQRAKPILAAALELDSASRSAFLHQACADPSLRQELESLIVVHEQAGTNALEAGPVPSFLESALNLRSTLTSGARLGDFQILSPLGAGGMGEVYRARDLRLDRDVAIKVLPRFVSLDPERLRRFEQEAKAAAALNHPNILAVFQMGSYEDAPYLVSELLEGETLRELVKRGPIPPKKAIEHAVQIAHGLAAAHEKGIVHRDLKPENLFITRDARIKILDFGLAKLMQPESETQLTKQTLATQPGAVMGTVGYMAPEQVRGLPADHRADIFAFGTILYEMLTGKRAFSKSTSADTMSAILNEEPSPVSQTTPNVPPALDRAVHRCLEKSPEQRFQSASDLAFALELSSDSGGPSANGSASAKPRTTWKWIAATGVALVLVAGTLFAWRARSSRPLTEKDTIVVADVANSTGDPLFDDTLKQALTAALGQSSSLNVLSDSGVATTLRLMRRQPRTALTPEIAREICQRNDGKAWIEGSISSIGTEYVIGLKAGNCQSGDSLAQEQITATTKERVLEALGQAARKLRGELGESLPNVRKFDVPLTQTTTSSLEALKALSVGRKNSHEKGPRTAIPFLEHAIELDPDYAEAYLTLGKIYLTNEEVSRARELFTKAFSLREQVSEAERFDIDSMYYKYVTGDLANATRVYREWLNSYPHASAALGNLARSYDAMGKYEESVELNRQAQRESANAIGYATSVWALMAVNQFAEARSTIQEAFDRKLGSDELHSELYTLAFLADDKQGMAEQVAWSNKSTEAMLDLLPLQASAEAYSGHLRKSLDLSHLAVDSMQREGQKERAASEITVTALREAEFGNPQEARRTVASVPLSQLGDDVVATRALAVAISGDVAHAESLLDTLAKRYPKGTLVQFVILPTVQARVELFRDHADKSIQLLHAAEPYELSDAALGSCIYPAYVRGQAYLALKNGSAAEVEFRKILGHSGVVKICQTGALARLGLARAYVMQGETAKAKAAYQDFLTLWKDADPDIPILKEAKAEFARLP